MYRQELSGPPHVEPRDRNTRRAGGDIATSLADSRACDPHELAARHELEEAVAVELGS